MTRIIPAIDIIGGKCVRLVRGDYAQAKTYSANPVDMAKSFVDAGCERLHLVDLDGAKGGHVVNYKVIETIASSTPLAIDFGGGIKSEEDAHIAFEAGARMITGGSIAVKNPELFLELLNHYGAERVILGADAKDGKIAVSGWMEDSDCEILDFIADYADKGVSTVISTDVAVDGTLEGPSIKLYRSIQERTPQVHIIASGGVSSMNDIDALSELLIPDVIVGKAIYEGRITLADLERYNVKR
ncbi:MAG: 1-(5-phosphoribosyl)-5-[(5-phosphoribosylamino)methylideneamino]imidazole-4-carboxamide isomerase [Muribaculaceae bacterium]|nr:1-(5-phosphoribosyl)-5-[(5-phosphoribosylamino)methylideneamino]imidazole-4-carboxamide isomerase [Muribaculaceae bacterium]